MINEENDGQRNFGRIHPSELTPNSTSSYTLVDDIRNGAVLKFNDITRRVNNNIATELTGVNKQEAATILVCGSVILIASSILQYHDKIPLLNFKI